MYKDYCRTATTVSLINYHFVFCPKYRRKIFDMPGVEERFKALILEKSKSLGLEILAMECHRDHAHIFISGNPKYSPAQIISQLKGYTSRILRKEYPRLSKMPCLWTRSYYVGTAGNVSSETIARYVETQKTRP